MDQEPGVTAQHLPPGSDQEFVFIDPGSDQEFVFIDPGQV